MGQRAEWIKKGDIKHKKWYSNGIVVRCPKCGNIYLTKYEKIYDNIGKIRRKGKIWECMNRQRN